VATEIWSRKLCWRRIKERELAPDFPVIEGYNDGYPRTSPVGSFEANQFGLFDMWGNAWQWCEDWFNAKMEFRVWRGASWYNSNPDNLRASFRSYYPPLNRNVTVGFRCVVAVKSSQ
jgi:formylglycine-generating enzyme required for sulfatase activity